MWYLPSKTKLVAEWPEPTSVKEVRSFLGLTSYYCRFIKGYAEVAAPLHNLTRKDVTFRWTQGAQVAFDTLKTALISPPILAMPIDEGEMILDTDASDKSIGSVLSQIQNGEERVIAYAGRILDKRELNYCVTRKELLAVVYSLKHFRQYLLGSKFKIRTDHAPLTWLRKTPEPIGQQARWLEIMEEYKFEVIHRPGVKHTNADALSRRPCSLKSCCCRQGEKLVEIMPSSVNSTVVRSTEICSDNNNFWSLEGIKFEQEADENISVIIQFLNKSADKPPWEEVAMLNHAGAMASVIQNQHHLMLMENC